MARIRWAALVAAIAVVLVVGLTSSGVLGASNASRPEAMSEGLSGSVSSRTGTSGHALSAVEVGRPPVVLRSESSHASRVLAPALIAAALLVAATGGRGPVLRRLLELSIRSQTDWWRPAPGGRAPPTLSAL